MYVVNKEMVPLSNAGGPAEAPVPDVFAQTPSTPLAPFPGMAADPVCAAPLFRQSSSALKCSG